MFQFEELNEQTRAAMLREYEAEQDSADPYRSSELSHRGQEAFVDLMREAIEHHDEEWIIEQIDQPGYWIKDQSRFRAERLARTEYNTWYVRGLCRKLMDEGETCVEVYRAAPARQPRRECRQHEGKQYKAIDIYRGHRAGYHKGIIALSNQRPTPSAGRTS